MLGDLALPDGHPGKSRSGLIRRTVLAGDSAIFPVRFLHDPGPLLLSLDQWGQRVLGPRVLDLPPVIRTLNCRDQASSKLHPYSMP